ncbi:protein HOMOLOG OF MAMMALIAN LYST-INTERACTING PROTEIN 5 [Iris pallida]|uniref:Protein HOMOLOG OF MAMMALIAN LYST-INTERACTING PROTEIN 5 n=1 Tax=Iris pallida TaxID=29817 RepID=A0AAX6E4R7_IRIPA|nr:protein HOMOLOG OF MAMMALIAN LYST-INTERACTING PROTEIN 5 [Iris pallida]
MGSESEPAKLLLPFLQRADELQKHEPLVAYYCRMYAMERGLRIPPKDRTKTTNSLLISLMNQLEKDKKSINLGPEDNLYVEGFASNVFTKADKQDRAGRADLNTAKTFYAASIFFEILTQFGDLQPDIEQKLKYAIWKAADIRKAIKEGRKPEPGPPGGEKDLSIPSSSPTSSYDLGPSQSFSASHPGADTPTRPVEKDPGQSEGFTTGYPGADLSSQAPDRMNLGRSGSFTTKHPGADQSSQPLDRVNHHGSSQPPASPSSYPGTDYPPGDYQQIPPSNSPDISSYPQAYHHQSYSNDQPSAPQNYHPENSTPPPPYSYPNFQSYPSFHETTFPAAPTHQPSYYHGATDATTYTHQSSVPSVSNYSSPSMNYDSGSIGNHVAPPVPAAPSYKYDPNYQPSVEKIAEAHKAARFAVGALAFDDVAIAVDFLQKSLELLTNPSAETH